MTARPEAPAAARNALPLVVQIESGQGQLSLTSFGLSHVGRVDALAMTVPNLRFPFDLSGGSTRFANRRCQLNQLTLSLSANDVVRLLARAPLAQVGILRPIVEMGPDGFTLQARVEVGSHGAELLAAGYFRVLQPRRLRVAVYDLRLHGFLPIGAPQVITALLKAVCGSILDHGPADRPPFAYLQGPTEVVVEPLELALLDLFPMRGWRMPGRGGLGLLPLGHGGDRVLLRFAPLTRAADDDDEFSFGSSSTHSGGRAAYEEGRSLFAEAESHLATGDVAAALALYRRAATLHSGNVFVATRLLQLLCITPQSLREAEELASALLARMPGFAPALLARAVSALAQGRSAEAAELYEQLAQAGEALPSLEAATALTAAAEAYLEAGQTERALGLLESVRVARPGHPRALDVLRRIFGVQKRWSEWLALLRRRELEEPSPVARAKLLCDAGQVLFDELGQVDKAAERFAEAVVLDEMLAPAWLGLGRARKASRNHDGARLALEKAVALFAAMRATDSQAEALAALAQCEESAGVDAAAEAHWAQALTLQPGAVAWLQQRARVLSRLGRGEEAAQLLASASAVSEGDDKLDLDVERAGLLGRVLGDKARGRVALDDVLRSNPAHLGALDELAAQAAAEDLGDVLVRFERALERITDPVIFAAVLGRARDVADRAGQSDFVTRALATASATGTNAGARAAIAWAEEWLAETAGPAEQHAAVAADLVRIIEGYLSSTTGAAGPLHGELALMRGRLAEAQGDDEAALAAFEKGLEGAAAFDVCLELGQRSSQLWSAQGKPSAAAKALVQSIEQAGTPRAGSNESERVAEVWIAAAKLFEQAESKDAALAAWQSASERDPSRGEAWRALQEAYEARGEWELVARTLQAHAANTRLAERRDAFAKLGWVYAQHLADPAQADAAYARALEVDAEHVPSLLWGAARAWDEGRLDEAATISERLLRVAGRPDGRGLVSSRDKANAHLRLSRWDRLTGSLADAEAHLERALAQEPHGADLALLVDGLDSAGFAEALVKALAGRLELAAPLSPEQHEIEMAYARALERLGRSDEALAVYRRRLVAAPEDLETQKRLIELCRRESRFDELLLTLERLLAVSEQQSDSTEPREPDPLVLKLEIARALWRSGKDVERAEDMLRALMQSPAVLKEAGDSLGRLLLARGAWQQADEVLARAGLIEPSSTEAHSSTPTPDNETASDFVNAPGSAVELAPLAPAIEEPALVVERARARLEGEAGVPAAYAVLQGWPLPTLPVAGLALRAELARKVGNESDVAAVLAEASARLAPGAAGVDGALTAADRDAFLQLADLGLPGGLGPLPLLERLAERGPVDAAAAQQLAALYEALGDVSGHEDKIAALLAPPSELEPTVKGRLWLKLAQHAITQDDHAAAEERFARALAEPVPAPIRAGWLVARAAFAVSQKALDAAVADLDEALAADPNHVGALGAFAELSYRLQDWAEARRAYEALSEKPDHTGVIEPVLLAFRRAELAEMFGDEAAAEANYRKVLELEPTHAGASEALAEFAYLREDHAEVVKLLAPVLQSLPAEAVGRRVALCERMGECLLALDNAAAARTYLEEATRLEPTRLTALQRLTQAAEMLGDHVSAASLWNRLSRLYTLPRERARALFREGELRRVSLQESTGAMDAYLRSADMDPTFAPALVRLVPFYWQRGEVLDVAGVAADLQANEEGREAAQAEQLSLILCLASAAAGDAVLAAKIAPPVWPAASEIYAALSELAAFAPDAASAKRRCEAAWALLKEVLPQPLAEETMRVAASTAPDAADVVKRLATLLT
ncbi:MAG: tetratricopeptide repeat protein [Deltaproteobacteria bacterium]|nr:tetratricopeptide repeat protein [Deltaproteobacteria bacterium]